MSKYEPYDFGAMRREFDSLKKIILGGTVTERCGKHLSECCPQVENGCATGAQYLRIDFREVFHAFDDNIFGRFNRLEKI